MTIDHDSTPFEDPSKISDIGPDQAKSELLQAAAAQTLSNALFDWMQILLQPNLFSSQPNQFVLGQVVGTRGAIELLERTGTNVNDLLNRHRQDDHGLANSAGVDADAMARHYGNYALSIYEVGPKSERIWIITEHDRNVTTVLLPHEYGNY